MHPTIVPSFAPVGGGSTSPANEQSLDAWSGHSPPPATSNVNASTPSQREVHKDDRPQPEHSAMGMDDAIVGMDLQSDAEAPRRPSSDDAAAVAFVAPSVVAAASVVTVDDTDRMCNGGNKGGGTAKNNKKKKELVFLEGVPLVDLDDTDVPDKKLFGDSKDIDDEEASNREHMDVHVGTPSCVQTIRPSSSTASTQFRLQYQSKLIFLFSHLVASRTP